MSSRWGLMLEACRAHLVDVCKHHNDRFDETNAPVAGVALIPGTTVDGHLDEDSEDSADRDRVERACSGQGIRLFNIVCCESRGRDIFVGT